MKKYILSLYLLVVLLLASCGGNSTCSHDYQLNKTVEVTCTADGYTEYVCTLCGDSYKSDIIRTKGHQTYVSKEGYPTSCEEAGLSDELSCSVCNQVVKKQEKI